MKPKLYQIIARFIFPLEYTELRRFVRENIGHAVRCPGSSTADRVATASHNLRVQFGK